MELLDVFKKKGVEMSMVKIVWEVQDLDLLVEVTWNILGVIESGRIGCGEKRWDDVLRVFREGNSMKEDVEQFSDDRARMMGWCRIAMVVE